MNEYQFIIDLPDLELVMSLEDYLDAHYLEYKCEESDEILIITFNIDQTDLYRQFAFTCIESDYNKLKEQYDKKVEYIGNGLLLEAEGILNESIWISRTGTSI